MLPRFLSPGPLFALEMTTSVRRIRYFVMRVMYATLLLFALFIAYQSYNLNAYASSSEINAVALFAWTFFQEYSWLQLFAVVVAGPALAAGTIASEREHRTIEYLFTTTLSNAEIIFGKLLSRLVHLGYLVLAGVPILSIAMLMGGIAPQAIVLLMIMTLSTALTVSIISITVSVWTARARDAVVRAYLVIFFLLFLPLLMIPLNGTWVYYIIFPVVEQFQLANPFWVLSHILIMGSATNTAGAWDMLFEMVRNQAIVCVLGITASTLMVRRVHLKAGGSVPKKRRNRRSWFRPAMGDRPMLWKEISVESVASRLGMIGRIAMLLILIGVLTPTVYMFYLSTTTPTYNNRSPQYLIYSSIMGRGRLLRRPVADRRPGSRIDYLGKGTRLLGVAPYHAFGTERDYHRQDRRKSLGSTGIFIVMAIIWGLGIIVESGLHQSRGVYGGHFFASSRICQRIGCDVFALVPHFHSGNVGYPGHRVVCGRGISDLRRPFAHQYAKQRRISCLRLYSLSFIISGSYLCGRAHLHPKNLRYFSHMQPE